MPHDVIRYAFKSLPKRVGAQSLGKRVEELLAAIDDPKERAEMRSRLLTAKAAKNGKA